MLWREEIGGRRGLNSREFSGRRRKGEAGQFARLAGVCVGDQEKPQSHAAHIEQRDSGNGKISETLRS